MFILELIADFIVEVIGWKRFFGLVVLFIIIIFIIAWLR